MKRNAELVECLFKFGIDLLRTVLILLRGCIVDDILKVNLRNIQMGPGREFHFLPAAESFQAEVQHPLRLIFLS